MAKITSKFPVSLAAKLVRDCKSLSQDEAGEFVNAAVEFHSLCIVQASIILELQKGLEIAETCVKLLQVEEV